METHRKLLIFTLISAALAGCGTQSDTTSASISGGSTPCGSGVANIIVTDGFMRRLCGCDETSTDPAIPPATLTCTVPSGTSVFFQYVGQSLKHQVQSTGALTFSPSAIYDPSSAGTFRTHAVVLTTTGTYSFQDLFDRALQGQIIVR